MSDQGEVTALLLVASRGDRDALDRLTPLVYDNLKRIARARLRGESPYHTLNTTALVHEVYLKLIDQNEVEWKDRTHFFAVSARAMRRILVDHARQRGAVKRGKGAIRIPFEKANLSVDERTEDLLALDEALDRLSRVSERLTRVVEYRFFAGMTEGEVAEALGVTPRTVRRDWTKARGLLLMQLSNG